MKKRIKVDCFISNAIKRQSPPGSSSDLTDINLPKSTTSFIKKFDKPETDPVKPFNFDEEHSMSKIRVHHFRPGYRVGAYNDVFHNGELGCHGKDPKYCRACVTVVIAVLDHSDGTCSLGAAFRNPADQFNRKLARRIAVGRLMVGGEDIRYKTVDVWAMIDRSYNEKMYRYQLKKFWQDFMVIKFI